MEASRVDLKLAGFDSRTAAELFRLHWHIDVDIDNFDQSNLVFFIEADKYSYKYNIVFIKSSATFKIDAS